MPWALCIALLAALTGCADSKAKSESAAFIHLLDTLRLASNDAKRPHLEQLRAFSCSVPQVCEARDACVLAFSHHVRGTELTAEIQASLAAAAAADAALPQTTRDSLARTLLEANLENEQGNALMPACDQAAVHLRIGRK
jgi:hypothetical protein